MTNPLIFEVEVSPASVAVELEPSHVDVIRDADPRVIVVATPGPPGTAVIADNSITNAKMADDAIGIAELSTTGTPSATTFLRGDNTWSTPAGSGGGTVASVVAGNNIDVDATDPANPIVSVETLTATDISDSSSTGRAVVTAADAAAGRTAIGAQASLGFTPENAANKNQANGYASLDGSGLVPAAQLPSYVDDVLEFANTAAFPGTGTTGKIYVALDTGKIYRWSGSAYIEISPSPGSTDSVTEGATNLYYTNARADARVVAGITGKADKTTTVSAGTGLTGGGDLSANRTLTVSYGTSSTTACVGNDSRLSDTRTPTDNTVTSAKIVDGSIVDADINTSAAIAVSKLGTGKVTGTVNTTATSLILWTGTQAQYDALGAGRPSTTVYVVTA